MDTLLTTAGGRAVLVVVLLAGASLAWWLRARRSGTVRSTRTSAPLVGDELLATLRAAGATLGARATYVQLSSEVCTPCRRTAAVLGRLVEETPGVHHVELDAAHHPELVRSLRVLRTPTVLVLDGDGRERGRSSGGMTPVQARAALEVVPGLVRHEAPSHSASGPAPTTTSLPPALADRSRPARESAPPTATTTATTATRQHLDETRRP